MGVLDESVLNLRVLPNDIDITNITNDRFLALMDLGRMDIVFRTGLLKSMFKNKWVPLTTFATIRFRYPLKLFQKYQLRTRILWWDDATIYCKQVFERKGRVVATGYACASFRGSHGSIPPNEMLTETGQTVTKPSEPEILAKLRGIENTIHKSQKG
jgi:acyl-CoA thioesterase FadM